ncbi:hypothetical protein BKA61DRAFT_35146 [Leptodontidium sp. MPI-SDFR-AT-0119]|nr:hypothetical protein BKA61DRAFT_35146 [Leptodontidium sp. MPI-SDFR-AT-0119]
MAVGCKKNGGPCDLEKFADWIKQTVKPKLRGDDGEILNDQPKMFKPDFKKVNWAEIGDGASFNQDKFDSAMKAAQFEGNVLSDRVFTSKLDSFDKSMSQAEDIILRAQEQLKSKGISDEANLRYKALQNALEIHANARRWDTAKFVVNGFKEWAEDPSRNYKVEVGEEIWHPPALPYNKIDAEKTVKTNKLEGDKVAEVMSWVTEHNKAGAAQRHLGPIKRADEIVKNLAAACKK